MEKDPLDHFDHEQIAKFTISSRINQLQSQLEFGLEKSWLDFFNPALSPPTQIKFIEPSLYFQYILLQLSQKLAFKKNHNELYYQNAVQTIDQLIVTGTERTKRILHYIDCGMKIIQERKQNDRA